MSNKQEPVETTNTEAVEEEIKEEKPVEKFSRAELLKIISFAPTSLIQQFACISSYYLGYTAQSEKEDKEQEEDINLRINYINEVFSAIGRLQKLACVSSNGKTLESQVSVSEDDKLVFNAVLYFYRNFYKPAKEKAESMDSKYNEFSDAIKRDLDNWKINPDSFGYKLVMQMVRYIWIKNDNIDECLEYMVKATNKSKGTINSSLFSIIRSSVYFANGKYLIDGINYRSAFESFYYNILNAKNNHFSDNSSTD